jgi:hypothetical protein
VRHIHQITIHVYSFLLLNSIFYRNRNPISAAQNHLLSPIFICDQMYNRSAEPNRYPAVTRRWRSTTLEVTHDGHANLDIHAVRKDIAHQIPDAARHHQTAPVITKLLTSAYRGNTLRNVNHAVIPPHTS